MTTREDVWPAAAGRVRGWPMPDAAWDDDCPEDARAPGWLPWAIWQATPDWYIAFYTCDRGHAWTCGYGEVANRGELRQYRVSPVRRLPSDTYLRRHVGEPRDIRLRLLDWDRE